MKAAERPMWIVQPDGKMNLFWVPVHPTTGGPDWAEFRKKADDMRFEEEFARAAQSWWEVCDAVRYHHRFRKAA